MKLIFYILFLFGSISTGFCQSSLHFSGVGLDGRFGILMPHKYELAHLPNSFLRGGSISFYSCTDGSKTWHEHYNYPLLGAHFSYFTTGNKEILGNAGSLTVSGHFPLTKSKLYPSVTPHFGLGWVGKVYDVETNPKNNVMGAHLNANVNLEFALNYKFDRNRIGLGFALKHFSNGASKLPNLGLNWAMLTFDYKYFFDAENRVQAQDKVNEFTWKHRLMGVFSMKDIYPLYQGLSPVFNLSYLANRRINFKSGVDLGLETFYNTALNRNYDEKVSFIEGVQIGVYVAYVQYIGNLELFLGMGTYVKNAKHGLYNVYNRLGGRYKVYKNLSIHFAIKSNLEIADYFEYGLVWELK